VSGSSSPDATNLSKPVFLKGTIMPKAWQPSPQGIAVLAATLQPYRHDPDNYWSLLLGLLHDQLVELIDEHREGCSRRDCRVCFHLACVETTLAGHDAVQPSGCACPDHRVYPHRPLFGPAEEAHLN
jgi:hypothetical protein